MSFDKGYMDGYMEKKAALTLPGEGVMKALGPAAVMLAIPSGIGYGAGMMVSKLNTPSARKADEAQMALLNNQIERVLDEMDVKDAINKMKEAHGAGGKTLRF